MVAGVSAAHLLFIAATVPAMGEEILAASHTVQFREASFTCGDTNQARKVVRFMRCDPGIEISARIFAQRKRPAGQDLGHHLSKHLRAGR